MKTAHKLLILFSLLLVLLVASVNGQTPQFVPKAKAQTEQSLTKTAFRTPFLYDSLPVYQSSKGSYFVVRKSKKTGNYYKDYLKKIN